MSNMSGGSVGPIKSIQNVTASGARNIAFTAVTIASVVVANSMLVLLGCKNPTSNADVPLTVEIVLTNATTVSFRTDAADANAVEVSFQVVEFKS